MAKFAQRLGYPIVDLAFYDVVSLEPDMWLSMVPTPVAAVIVVFPLKDVHKEHRNQQFEDNKDDENQAVFIKERIENGCGTLALLHAILNTRQFMTNAGFVEGSFLDNFQISNMGADSEQMADYLSNDTEIEKIHQEMALDGKTSVDSNTGSHIITFVELDGKVYELDGCMPGPLCKGEIEGANLGIKVSSIVNEYMAMDPDETKFSVLAMAQNYCSFDF